MCMCIEFVIQVPKQKNAHVSFPVGMVFFALSFPRGGRQLIHAGDSVEVTGLPRETGRFGAPKTAHSFSGKEGKCDTKR